ncbi:MAG: long-chain fatty acid--CoA ligase [Candidatus Velthaea sp.]
MTVGEWLHRSAVWHPEKEALVDGARRLTYAALNERANRQANGLLAAGLRKGDRVAIIMNNTLEAVECIAAAAKGGFVHVPINFRFSAEEITDVLRDCGSRAIIIDREYADRVRQDQCPELERVFVVEPGTPDSAFERWLAEQSPAEPAVDVTADDNLLIIYTSGATGTPKGVLMAHRQSVAHGPNAMFTYQIEASSRLLLVYPHNSIASANMFYFPAWMLGATVVLTDVRRFSGERWLQLIEAERITHSHCVPTMLFRVLESPQLGKHDVSTLAVLGYGSAPMPFDRVKRLSEIFGDIMLHGYGLTECSSLVAVHGPQDHARAFHAKSERLRSCGRPTFTCQVRIVDDAGNDAAPGELGELIVRSPHVMSGYWNDPVRTAAAIQDGWLRSGDLATVDADGYLYIVDRKKDLIISGGANIASREVEDVLYCHPAVREAAVIGVPSEEWGERVRAFVSVQAGCTVTPEELIAFSREHIAHYKCPDAIDILPDLPKNPLGKILKSELRAPFINRPKVLG